MKDISSFSKICLAIKPVDFRKQSNGLVVIIKETLGSQPFDSKSLYVFINKKKTSVRMIYWDFTGFALWGKILEKDKFRWPKRFEESSSIISHRELKWLLQGVDLDRIKIHEPLTFEKTF